MREPDEELAQPGDYVTIRFRLLNPNYEKLWTAAAMNGESREEVLNRAVALYEILHRAEPHKAVSWKDVDGNIRQVYVMPVRSAQKEPVTGTWHEVRFAFSCASILIGALLLTLIGAWAFIVLGAGVAALGYSLWLLKRS